VPLTVEAHEFHYPPPGHGVSAAPPGRLELVNGRWQIQAQPHVSTRLKRIFPRAQWTRAGQLTLSDTPEVARDLDWVLTRWPLEVDSKSRRHLKAQAREHRRTEDAVAAILAGYTAPTQLREPARPARPYQQQAVDLLRATRRLLLADEVGLGKSMSANLLLLDPDALPALVVTLTHLPRQWVSEIEKTTPWLRAHIATKGTAYDLRERLGYVPDVLIMNYAKLAGWREHLAGQVRTVIFDEVQELRRDGSEKYKAAARIAGAAAYRAGLSATPVFNYGGEIHNIMQILAPDALGSRDEFIREWGGGTYGMAQNVGVKDPAALGLYLREQGLMLRRTRKDIHRELPDPVVIEQHVDTDPDVLVNLTGDVAEIAALVLDSDADREDKFRAAGDLDWRMRHATGLAKAPFVAEFVKLLLESEEKVLLFGWHRDCYQVWAQRLAEFNPVFYTGTESTTQKQQNAQAFLHGDSRVLVMSLRAGAGLDGLQDVCSVAVFGELDWSPGVHEQCIGRLQRDGQDSTVAAYYLVSEGGADPLMAEVLGIKRQQSDAIRDPEADLLIPAHDHSDRVKELARRVLHRTTTGPAS